MPDTQNGIYSQADGFYREFEEKHRGSRELIKSRLRIYLPFIEPLKEAQRHPKATDLGCGRGEWLELLTEVGFDVRGVDLDDGMLEACYERNLPASKGDAVDFLKSLPDATQLVVSGFHIAEHLPFPTLCILVQEALRVLQPGGLLILETPNPENLVVAGKNFYLDPTHQRPLPPELLCFLPEYYGFSRTKVVRLQEAPELTSSPKVTLSQVLGGVSPDYAVIAQKAADARLLASADEAFNVDYGLTLEELASRFDKQIVSQLEAMAEMSETLRSIRVAQENDSLAMGKALEAREAEIARLSQRLADMDVSASELMLQNATLKQQLVAVYHATSWRVTAPLRLVSRMARWFICGAGAWITLKAGSRPRRVAIAVRALIGPARATERNVTRNDANSCEHDRPDTLSEASSLSGALPNENVGGKGVAILGVLDTSAETESVQRLYRQFIQARRFRLERRQD